jgi:hypothetical protein
MTDIAATLASATIDALGWVCIDIEPVATSECTVKIGGITTRSETGGRAR